MLTVALGLFAALVVLATLVHLLEPRLAFFPMAGESVTPRDFGVDYDSAAVRTRDGERLCSWSLAGPATRARLVYFHGNGGNLSTWAPIVAGIARRGYPVFAFDYRGYGVSTGRPTEQGMCRDAKHAIKFHVSRCGSSVLHFLMRRSENQPAGRRSTSGDPHDPVTGRRPGAAVGITIVRSR